MSDCRPVRPAPWHIDPVHPDDDRKIREIMSAREALTGDEQTKSGTIRRAVRMLWQKEVEGQ